MNHSPSTPLSPSPSFRRHRPASASLSSIQTIFEGKQRPLSGTFSHSPLTAFTPGNGHSTPMVDRGFNGWGGWQPQGHDDYEETQHRSFCRWLNTRLEPAGYPPVTDLSRDFADGTRLIQLVEVLTEESLGKYNLSPGTPYQMGENLNMALDKIKKAGVHLTNIGSEGQRHIMKGNRKLVLGLVWKLVQNYLIADINEEGSHAKEGLLLWCQRRTRPYEEVDIQNFSRSWQDGLAFCALIHRHRPELLDYDSLDKTPKSAAANTKKAFEVAEAHLGIPQLLDVEDVCGARRPDEKSVMTYVAQFFHAFASKAREETEAKIINNFVENISSLLAGIHKYEERVKAFKLDVATLVDLWKSSPPVPFYVSLKQDQADFVQHKLTKKREWVKERGELSALLGHIQTKLKTYDMKAYEPAEGLKLSDVEASWQVLLKAEAHRSRTINALIRKIKEDLRVRFAGLANEFERELQHLASRLSSIGGPLDKQLQELLALQGQLQVLSASLRPIADAEQDCMECNVDENDFTIYSYDDLDFEYTQLSSDVSARKAFVDNQIVARSVTNVTPEQLEEFESAFRAFDKDLSNTLDLDELVGALGSLGIAEQVDKTEDRLTGDKLRTTFKAVGGEKGYITELDLTRIHLSSKSTKFLKENVPIDETSSAFDFDGFLDGILLE
ncbi:actin cross-linking [Pseudohyphozyma bogoriensis]|nr:actin cross-linking [Pseudohyphozyma bogoriensis]